MPKNCGDYEDAHKSPVRFPEIRIYRFDTRGLKRLGSVNQNSQRNTHKKRIRNDSYQVTVKIEYLLVGILLNAKRALAGTNNNMRSDENQKPDDKKTGYLKYPI